MEQYVMLPAIKKKLAQSKERILYLYGVAGCGKTTAVMYHLQKKKYKYFIANEITEDEFDEGADLIKDIVVIDDLQWVEDETQKRLIRELCKQKENNLILMGRGYLPEWLADIALYKSFLQCDESNFTFGKKEVAELADKMKIKISDEVLDYILSETEGYIVGIKLILNHMEAGEDSYHDIKLRQQILKEAYAYIDRACFDVWDRELKEILLPLAYFDSFSIEMAELITGKKGVGRIIQYANSVGSFLRQTEEGQWELTKRVRGFLKWKCTHVYSKEDYAQFYRQAALYYKMQGNLKLALQYYDLGDNQREITKLLIQNANEHPGVAQFFECRHYYMRLPEEEIVQNPNLMAGMSMLYSILFMPEESEKYYQALESYSKEKYRTQSEKKEAKTRLAYLNIALPHRGAQGILQSMKDTFILVNKKELVLPEFSVTGNLPSLMYGGKDFSEWSKMDTELSVALRKPLELLLGRARKGIVNIALAESGYEKGSMEDYELQTRLNTGYMMAEAGGTIEMCFAATGVLIRLHIARGQIQVAKSLLTSFRTKAAKEGATHLTLNMEAMNQWLAMLNGEQSSVKQWLKEAPDEKTDFCTLSRYVYLQKIRAYLLMQRYSEATALVEKLGLYFASYERHHDLIENLLLKSILLYRTNDITWKKTLTEALKRAENYHFVRVVAQEGAALKPLIESYEKEEVKEFTKEISEDFLREVTEAVKKMARFYPDYLQTREATPELLTKTERKILNLLCQGESAEGICDICNITYNSLKFHNKNIYKKLGVNSRLEAEQKAKQLGL